MGRKRDPIQPPDPKVPDNVWDLSDIPRWAQTGKNGTQRKEYRTAQSLGLNIEAAVAGKHWKILPKRHYYNWDSYPLPSDKNDLFRIAVLDGRPRSHSPGRQYIHRCAEAYREWIKHRSAMRLGAANQVANDEVKTIREKRKEADKELDNFKEELQQKVQVAQASLAELYDLAGQGFRKIMTAFRDGETINGEAVTPNEFTNAAKTCFAQVARLGTPATEDAKDEAKEIVFQEARKEMREKLRLIEGGTIQIGGKEAS